MIKLTEKDIGKRVELRNGLTGVIKECSLGNKYPYQVIIDGGEDTISLTREGNYWHGSRGNEKDIVEILDD